METWSSAITGLAVFLASSGLGVVAIVGYQMCWELGGMVAIILTGQSEHVVRVVEEHTIMGPIVWLLLLVGSVSLGISVWMMDSIAQRMGPPYCD